MNDKKRSLKVKNDTFNGMEEVDFNNFLLNFIFKDTRKRRFYFKNDVLLWLPGKYEARFEMQPLKRNHEYYKI
jgi:hypothetical protein